MDRLIEQYAAKVGMTREQLMEKTKKREVVEPRQVIQYILIYDANIMMEVVAERFEQESSTLSRAMTKVKSMMENNDERIISLYNKIKST